MSRAEVEALSDDDLKKQWEQIKVAYRSSLPQHLSDHQSLVLFADFINVSSEMDKRGIKTNEQ